MTDQHVDDLLEDLDRALAVEPSPSVAARVRTSVAHDTGVGWFERHWRGIAVGTAALVVIAAIVRPWFDASPVPSPLPAASAEVKAVPAPAATPSTAAVATPAAGGSKLSRVALRAERGPEPAVIVSPNQRLALDQLAAAVRDGRINSDSFPLEEEPKPLDVVRITPIVLDLVTIGRQPGIVF